MSPSAQHPSAFGSANPFNSFSHQQRSRSCPTPLHSTYLYNLHYLSCPVLIERHRSSSPLFLPAGHDSSVPSKSLFPHRFSPVGPVVIRKRDGYVIRAFDGLDLGNDNGYSFNGALKWKPSEKFDLFVRGDYSHRKEHGAPFVLAEVNEQAPVAAIASVGAGCPGATIPFAPIAPGNPRFGAPNVPLINDPRCANDLQAKGDFINGGNAPVMSMSRRVSVKFPVDASFEGCCRRCLALASGPLAKNARDVFEMYRDSRYFDLNASMISSCVGTGSGAGPL